MCVCVGRGGGGGGVRKGEGEKRKINKGSVGYLSSSHRCVRPKIIFVVMLRPPPIGK